MSASSLSVRFSKHEENFNTLNKNNKHSALGKEIETLGFTLLEVVLAVGLLALSLLALAGLLAQSARNLSQARSRIQTEALASELEVFLQAKDFQTVYKWIAQDTSKVLFYYTVQSDANTGREPTNSLLRDSTYTNLQDELSRSIGPVLKIILKNSPLSHSSSTGSEDAASLPANSGDYLQGYLALEAWIYTETPAEPGAAFDTGPEVRPKNFLDVRTYAVTRADHF